MDKQRNVFLVAIISGVSLGAQGTFVYTNNNQSPNSVSAFSVASDGALSPVPGSPFSTGGNGGGGGFATTPTAVVKNFLYAANLGSDTVAGFAINPVTGVLKPVPGSPFATGQLYGLSLTATPDNKFLIAASGIPTIAVFNIAANGALSQVPGSPFPSGATDVQFGAKVTSDGKYLAIASWPGNIRMYTISAAGGITPVFGPFSDAFADGIDCNCTSSQLYVAIAQSADSAKVDVLNIGLNGTLSRTAGSPFTGPGINSMVAVLNPNDSKLFVTNGWHPTPVANYSITVFDVAANGSLTAVPGSPFPVPGSRGLARMATNQAGTLLYAADLNNLISGFSVADNGALTAVPGSPFSNGFPGFGLASLVVFPPKNCCPTPVLADVSASPDVLWPPNKEFADVRVDYSVTGPCPQTCALRVSSNEQANEAADGNTSPDWQVIDAHRVLLRAARAGTGGDRIYTIRLTCTNDTNNLSSTKTVTVSVPHDRRR